MDPIKTFVSFSSRDNLFVRHLLARLYILGFNPWDYSLEGSELPVGRPIDLSLKEKIQNSTLFVVIISNNTIASEHCRNEVARAIGLHAEGRICIVPLLDRTYLDSQRDWPGPFAELKSKNLRYCNINVDKPLEAESALLEICQEVRKRYEPPAEDTSNFPFLTRLYKELVGLVPDKEDKGNSIYRHLYCAQIHFIAAVKRADYAEAFRKIQRIVTTLDDEFSSEQFYYPIIAKGVCQVECGDLLEALKTFRSLENHPLRDDNVSAGIGYVLCRQGKCREAAEIYLDALLSNRSDIALLHGYTVNSLFAGNKITYERVCNWVSDWKSDDPVLLSRISEMKGLALLSEARHSEAVRYFSELANDMHGQLGVIIQWSDALLRDNRVSEALEVLESFHEHFPENVSFLEQVARILRVQHNPARYIEVMDQLIQLEPNEWKHVMKKALALLQLGRENDGRKLAEDIIGRGRPQSDGDSYYRGMAFYLVGDLVHAEQDFRDSKRNERWEYSKLIPKRLPI